MQHLVLIYSSVTHRLCPSPIYMYPDLILSNDLFQCLSAGIVGIFVVLFFRLKKLVYRAW